MEQIFGNTKGARMMQGEKLTNFERVKSMSVDELAEFIENEDNLYKFCNKKYCDAYAEDGKYCDAYAEDGSCKAIKAGEKGCCVKAAKKWLESEVEDEI